METVADAKARIQETAESGGYDKKPGSCPCCNRVLKAYRRRIDSGMALSLRWLSSEFTRTNRWAYVPDAPPQVVKNRSWDKLELHGLVERRGPDFAGEWRPTKDGLDFASGETEVAEWALVFLGEVIKWAENFVGIEDCLPFNYEELLRG